MDTVVSSTGAACATAASVAAGACVGTGAAAGAQAESRIPAIIKTARSMERFFFILFSLKNGFPPDSKSQWI
jgi:hypothetical protein